MFWDSTNGLRKSTQFKETQLLTCLLAFLPNTTASHPASDAEVAVPKSNISFLRTGHVDLNQDSSWQDIIHLVITCQNVMIKCQNIPKTNQSLQHTENSTSEN